MRELNKVFPLITKSMLVWHLFLAAVIAVMTLFFVKSADDTPLKAYFITIAAGAVLASIPIFGFVRQLLERNWIRKHCVGYGHGVLYLADQIDYMDEFREEVAVLCQRDVVGEALSALMAILPNISKRLNRPKVVLAIAQPIVFHRPTARGKPWRVMGLALGNRIRLTWNVSMREKEGYLRLSELKAMRRTYRSLLGHEIGEVLLTCAGLYNVHSSARHAFIKEAGLDTLFLPTAVRRTVPHVDGAV